MGNKERKEALKRLKNYNKDMNAGLIDLSDCVKLATYPEPKGKASKVLIEKIKKSLEGK